MKAPSLRSARPPAATKRFHSQDVEPSRACRPWRRLVARLPELHLDYLKFIGEFVFDESGDWPEPNRRPGETIQHGKMHFHIQAVIGAGAEGCVYLVRTKHGERAIKQFYKYKCESIHSMQRALRTHRALRKKGLPLPELYSVRYSTRSALLEYIPSVPASYLFHNLDLPRDEFEALKRQIAKLYRRHREIHYLNVVIEVPSGTARPIEPN